MKRFTVGITTHNEGENVASLLTALESLKSSDVDIMLFDDASTDSTPLIVRQHPIYGKGNFHAHFATDNHGTPSLGRTYIGENAQTEYVALVDGDDRIDPTEFAKLIRVAPSDYDLILTPYSLRGKRVGLPDIGPIDLNATSVNRVLSGIGGKVYARRLLHAHGRDDVRGRSDDVRLNMRIVLSGHRGIFSLPDICFYQIEASRKSMLASSINLLEVQRRVEAYGILQRAYNVGDGYLLSLEKQLRMIARKDPTLKRHEMRALEGQIDAIFSRGSPPQLDRMDPTKKNVHTERSTDTRVLSKVEIVKQDPKLRAMEEEIRRLEQQREARRNAG